MLKFNPWFTFSKSSVHTYSLPRSLTFWKRQQFLCFPMVMCFKPHSAFLLFLCPLIREPSINNPITICSIHVKAPGFNWAHTLPTLQFAK